MSLKVVQSSLIRQVKSIGASVAAPILRAEVIKWIQSCSATVPSTSKSPPQMKDLNVILFDSHTDALAKELLERNVKNIFLFEGSQQNADKQKESVEDLEEKYPNSNITALHASMKNILCPSKSVKINLPLWQRFFDTQEVSPKFKNYPVPEKEESHVVMFGCLPFPTQQRALLQSLLEQLLIHYDISKEMAKKTKHIDSYFQLGSFSFITFLHASHFTRVISSPCDATTTKELKFYGRSHRTFSNLFNTLFNVEKLSNGIGYDLSMFQPQIPLSPIKAYLKPLQQLGYEENLLYPVKIVPRPFVSLPGISSDEDGIPFKLKTFERNEKNDAFIRKRKQILNYAYWMLATGKNPKKLKEVWDTLGLSNEETLPPKNVNEFSMYFPQISDKLEEHFSAEMNSFRAGLYNNKLDENVVD